MRAGPEASLLASALLSSSPTESRIKAATRVVSKNSAHRQQAQLCASCSGEERSTRRHESLCIERRKAHRFCDQKPTFPSSLASPSPAICGRADNEQKYHERRSYRLPFSFFRSVHNFGEPKDRLFGARSSRVSSHETRLSIVFVFTRDTEPCRALNISP